MRSLLFVFALLTASRLASAAPEVRRFTIVGGTPIAAIGKEVCTIKSPTERVCEWELVDRGLGPKLTAHIVVDAEGIPTLIENGGVDYDHNPVNERFSVVGDRARWDSSAEHGERSKPGRAFYLSQPGLQSPEEQAVLARALLRSANHRLPLLPGGEAAIERLGAIEVDNGKARKTVVQYEITGLDLVPDTLWLDEQNEAFCVGVTIAEGWQSVGAQLAKEEGKRADARRARLVASVARTPKGALALVHAGLFDPASGRVQPATTVVIEHTRVSAVGPDGSVSIPNDAEIIDARGKTLLPGLWDMHAHLNDEAGLECIAGGVTTARQMSSSAKSSGDLFKRFADGTAIGPRVLRVGLMDGPGPGESHAERVQSEAEVRAAVDRDADAGFPQVKIYNSFKREWIRAFVDEAHRRHLRISGHVPNHMKAADLVDAGFDEIQHAYFVFLNFLKEGEMMPMARFRVFADHAGEVDLSRPDVRKFIATLKKRNVDIDLTLVTGENLLARPGVVAPTYAAVADRLPAQKRRELIDGGGLPLDSGSDARYRAAFTATLKLARALHDAGVQIAVGTDEAIYGFSLHRELELLVEAGIAPAEVLRMATLGNAHIMKRDAESGSLAPGKLADFVLVDGDPTKRIADIRRTVLVGKGGTLYSPDAIYRSLGIRP